MLSRPPGIGSCSALAIVLAIGWLLAAPSAAQLTSTIVCDPDIRSDNPSCPDGLDCRRLTGNCGLFAGWCLDDPSSGTATATGDPHFCAWVCSGSTGRCEADERNCNCDQYGGSCAEPCSLGYACLDGFCQEGECAFDSDCPIGHSCNFARPTECVPPECTSAADCDNGLCDGGRCVECLDDFDCGELGVCDDGVCDDVECVYRAHCESWQTCYLHTCTDVCPEGVQYLHCPGVDPVGGCADATTPTCDDLTDCPLGSKCCGGFCFDRGPQGPDRPDDIPPPQDGPPPDGPGPPEAGDFYLFVLDKGPRWPEGTPPEKLHRAKPYREHVRYQQRLARRGVVTSSGLFADLSGSSGVIYARDEKTARKLLESDPAVRAGLYRVEALRRWQPTTAPERREREKR